MALKKEKGDGFCEADVADVPIGAVVEVVD